MHRITGIAGLLDILASFGDSGMIKGTKLGQQQHQDLQKGLWGTLYSRVLCMHLVGSWLDCSLCCGRVSSKQHMADGLAVHQAACCCDHSRWITGYLLYTWYYTSNMDRVKWLLNVPV